MARNTITFTTPAAAGIVYDIKAAGVVYDVGAMDVVPQCSMPEAGS